MPSQCREEEHRDKATGGEDEDATIELLLKHSDATLATYD
jgi:hypothetical protein